MPILAEAASAAGKVPTAAAMAAAIEVRLAGAVMRVVSDTDAALLTSVLRAVRASASAA